jgi:hypothetical protein
MIGAGRYAIIAAMITKRQLGFVLIGAGTLVIIAVLAANMMGARDAGFGPFQKMGLVVGGGIILLGLPLLRLGDRPA